MTSIFIVFLPTVLDNYLRRHLALHDAQNIHLCNKNKEMLWIHAATVKNLTKQRKNLPFTER